jgi:hypothetical protein
VFHELTTQSPHEVWLAIHRKARLPAPGYPPLHIVRFGGEILTAGCAIHQIDGVSVRITTLAKTVAQIAREHSVHPVQVSQWKTVIRERLPELFNSGGAACADSLWQEVELAEPVKSIPGWRIRVREGLKIVVAPQRRGGGLPVRQQHGVRSFKNIANAWRAAK